MDRTSPAKPTQWAVLVGVNYYGHPDQQLRGCVSDVTNMATYWSASSNPVEIMKLTYSGPTGVELGLNETDEAPTRDNVIASLDKIKRDALVGDYVYLHFSCHGTQVRDKAIGTTHEGTGDLALVLYDPNKGPQIFHTWHLATILKEMVERLLHVTVVLDCCFSGSTVRSDNGDRSSVRFVNYDPKFDENYPSFDFDLAATFLGIDNGRDARHICPLMVESSLYTMIAACGPHEIAKELCLNGLCKGPGYRQEHFTIISA
ncbi:hypothetical protein CDV31_009719 [Fusarium ambrosium]|uniref:Peptidase C14 caspase domain-containing protein n=1 Tax=Fusarium ambrosium TaxID=131363 RepID=A0A428TSU2_9HYPO|nr:hypothetical protein CDV31_009719 [Fusarium ambrosium]